MLTLAICAAILGIAPVSSSRSSDDVRPSAVELQSKSVQRSEPTPDLDVDTDGDGLSDFQEIHKYFTDPNKADTDGDGIPDGDWNERREYTYTVRTIVRVLPPVTDDVLHDDYQDARVLERTKDYVELEVIHYPLNTVASAITADPDWREHTAGLKKFIDPGLTANWDAPMQKALVDALLKDGIDARKLDDKTLVEHASKWLLAHAKYVDGFTTFCSWFPDGKAAIYPGLEATAESGKSEKKLSLEEQWRRELFAKGMFETGVHGSCTSSAIYMSGCLRALGIPTRVVLAIPLVDASNPDQVEMVKKGITHKGVRRIVSDAIAPLAHSWTSHTFDEVFVGGRWRRLNYDRLGQNILDSQFLGLMTHVDTFGDWADGEMAKTWGVRQSNNGNKHDVFGGPNPYSAKSVSDQFGAHAKIANDWLLGPDEFQSLTIERAYWLGSPECKVEMTLHDSDAAGAHAFMHVRESRAGVDSRQYLAFSRNASMDFVLRAEGRPDVHAHDTRGYWNDTQKGIREFYLRIDPDELAHMSLGVRYTVVPDQKEDADFRWNVAGDVFLVRDTSSTGIAKPAAKAAPAKSSSGKGEESLLLDRAMWSDDASVPAEISKSFDKDRPALLLHLGEGKRFDVLKPFTQKADLRFFLDAAGHSTISSTASTGGVTLGKEAYLVLPLGPGDWRDLASGVEYTLRAQNDRAGLRWRIADGLKVVRR